jgi:hypothetical protein
MKTLLWMVCATLPLLAQEPVRYVVSFPNAAHHEAEVRATFTGVRQPVPMKYCSVCKRPLPFEYSNCPYDGTALSFVAGDPPEQSAPARGGRGGGRGRGGQ